MKILANTKIRQLFMKIIVCIMLSAALIIGLLFLHIGNAFLMVSLSFLLMAIAIVFFLYRYFKEQNAIMEEAVMQITEYISGDQNARIQCNDEGELYRMFHEVNTLVSILNAHAESEGQAKKFLKDTISDISHQLKTPLAALNIYNGIMQEEAKNLPTVKEFTALSEQELDRIETLVQNLLKLTKLDAGTLVMEKSMENVSDMMEDIRKRFAFRAEQEGKQLILSGDEKMTLWCDRSWTLEAIGNIVKNAFDHTKPGSTISVTWRQFTSMSQIVIKDDGAGIHPEDLYHIFKRFYRSRFSKDTQGIGLGLPLAKRIIEAHNGTIEVDSQLGRGAVFTITFLIPTNL